MYSLSTRVRKHSCTTQTQPMLVLTSLTLAIPLLFPLPSFAESENGTLKEQVERLQSQIAVLQADVQSSSEWKNPNTLIHMAGYADAGYVKKKGEDGNFVVGSFSPIFHFQYRDIVMLEAELEFEVGENGETETNLEYMTIDWFVHDYVTFVAGKFLSPIGQFRQNLHPSWINKLPAAPPGFGHDGAAPVSDLGFQARGGFPVGGIRANYAVYVANGPELNSVTENGTEFELEGIRAEGLGGNANGEVTYGGRIGLLPFPALEIGLSLASGKASVTALENGSGIAGSGLETGPIEPDTSRDYDVTGADFVWNSGNTHLRGEYVKSKLGATAKGITAGDGATWTTWYTQASYHLPNTKFEGVIRYTDFDSPHASEDQQQTAIGLNYLITNNFIAKLAYEFNDGVADSNSDTDRTLIQLAYGF